MPAFPLSSAIKAKLDGWSIAECEVPHASFSNSIFQSVLYKSTQPCSEFNRTQPYMTHLTILTTCMLYSGTVVPDMPWGKEMLWHDARL